MTHPTVRIERGDAPNILRMVWDHEVFESDIKSAFQKLFDLLDDATQPQSIIVDLTSDPQFPLIETMMSALPSYRHARVSAWLVVGSNTFARYIAQFLGTAVKRANVHWFDNETEVVDFLAGMLTR